MAIGFCVAAFATLCTMVLDDAARYWLPATTFAVCTRYNSMNSGDFDMSAALDRQLNETLINTNICNGYEEFLAIFDHYYAGDMEVGSDMSPVPLTGKAHIRPILFKFLALLHVIVEIAGLSVTLQYSPIRTDSGTHYSDWSLDLQGVLGRSVTVHWSSARRWDGARVISERHFDHRQIGRPLTLIDLDVDGSVRRNANAKPS